MTSFRIVMDETRRTVIDGYSLIKRFHKGEVYDCRAEGEFHVPITVALYLLSKGWAHEQTNAEYLKKIDDNRQAILDDPHASEEAKNLIRMSVLSALPNHAMDGFSVAKEMRQHSETFAHLFDPQTGEVL